MSAGKVNPVVIDIALYEPSLLTAMEAYLKHVAARQSDGTVRKRRSCLIRFIHFLYESGIRRYQDMTTDDLWRYHRQLIDQDYSSHSTYSFIISVRLFCRYLTDTSLLFENPAASMELSKPRQKLGLVLSKGQMNALLRKPDITQPLGLRDRAIIELLYATGIRLNECYRLSVFDLDLDNHTVKVFGKGSKERVLPLGRHAVKYLSLYMKEARPRLIRDNDPPQELWLSARCARPMNDSSIRVMIQKHARTAGLPEETDTHTLRRTCATHMLRGGAHPIAVAHLLGHTGLASLAHYLKTTITDLTKTHKETKPGS